MVREWKTVATGHFNDTYFDEESAVCDGKYIVALSRAEVYPSYNMFDSNYVLLSQDSGKTWNGILKWGNERFDSSMKNWNNFYFNFVDMPKKNLIMVTGTYSNERLTFMCRSTNMGNTWELIKIPNDSLRFWSCQIIMYDESYGMLLMLRSPSSDNPITSYLYKTTDGCKTWTEMPVDQSVNTIHKCFSKDNWILATSSNLVITTDGGENWNYYEKPKWTYGISFLDNNRWIAVALMKIQDNPEIRTCSVYKTKNAGVDWELVSIINPYPFRTYAEPDFYDENNGIIAGYDELIRTTDCGLTWTYEVLPPESHGDPFNNVKFFAKERAIGFAGGFVYLYTGRTVLQSPGVQYTRKSGELWEYNIYWKKVIGADKYKVQIAQSIPHWSGGRLYSIPDFEEKLIIDTTGYKDTVISIKTRFYMDYYIRVKAYNDSLESDWSHFESFTTLRDTGNYPPLDACWPIFPMDGSHLKRNNIRFVWTRIKNAEKYNIYIATELNHSFGGINYAIYDITDTTYVLTSELESETKYYWWIIAQASKWADSKKVLAYFFTTKVISDVGDISVNDSFTVFPNPASEYIEINIGADSRWQSFDKLRMTEDGREEWDIQIYNVLGECVSNLTNALVNTPLTPLERGIRIDVSRLAVGMYFVRIGNEFQKFVVIK